ncbi:unnamed protein product [Polarella glacialis]|uniref:Protein DETOXIFICATION n=1 Tax=Polarella glacialis TaxID=89957 RepID=A0A813H1U6_POLGL|nr:unnamed protein product [Polarella glacialis]
MHEHVILTTSAVLALSYIVPVARHFAAPGLGQELKCHVRIAVPSVLRYLFFTISKSLFVALVGHMDADPVEHFDGAALGISLVNITGLSIGLGFLGAMAPFVAQECGSGRPDRCGLHLRNYYICTAVIFTCSWSISHWADVIMLSLGQDAKVSLCVQKFASIAVWSLPFQLIVKGIQQVLDAQADVVPGLVTDVTTALVQLPLAYFTLNAGYGYQGAAVSLVVCNALALAFLASWVFYTGRAKSVWHVDVQEPRAPMLPFLGLASYSVVACCIEWWAQECMIIWSGWLPSAPTMVAVQGILFTLACIFYMVWVGTKNAMSMRVGNLIGAGEASKVLQALLVGVVMGVVEVFMVLSVGFLLRDELIDAFTTNASVAAQIVEVWPVMLACFVPYSITFVLFGVLAGAGRQGVVACSFCACCFFGMCVGLHLCFVEDFSLKGLWFGNFAFFLSASVVLYTIVVRTDWNALESLSADYQSIDRKMTPTMDPHVDFLKKRNEAAPANSLLSAADSTGECSSSGSDFCETPR